MKSKVTIKIPPGLEAKVRSTLDDIIQQDEVLTEVGEIARKDIIANIEQAKEPSTGNGFADREISKGWKDRKSKLRATNQAYDSRSGGGSSLARLIFTGQWIQSFKTILAKQGSRKVITVGPTGIHKPYKNLDGTQSGQAISNVKLGEYFKSQGRNWTGFPERIRTRIVNVVRAHIRRELTKRNK
jgi:hypothetical protein